MKNRELPQLSGLFNVVLFFKQWVYLPKKHQTLFINPGGRMPIFHRQEGKRG
jgi:hypothetical protein